MSIDPENPFLNSSYSDVFQDTWMGQCKRNLKKGCGLFMNGCLASTGVVFGGALMVVIFISVFPIDAINLEVHIQD